MSVDPFWEGASGETNVLIFGTFYVLALVAYLGVRIMVIRLGLRGESFLGKVVGIVAVVLLGSLIVALTLVTLFIAPMIVTDPWQTGVLLAIALALLVWLLYKTFVWGR